MNLLQSHRWIAAAAAALSGVVAAVAPLAARPGGLRMGGIAVHAKASRRIVAGLAACLLATAHAATPPATPITNAATASFAMGGVSITIGGTTTVVTSSSTPASVQFVAYGPTAQGTAGAVVTNENVPVTQCSRGGAFTALPAPVVPGAGALAVPSVRPLVNATTYASGDVVFVRVTDFDQNIDPLVTETVTVTVGVSDGDSEVLRLTETGPSTGVFVGYIPTSRAGVSVGDCVLNIGGNQKLTATYIDESENRVAVIAGALIDPLGVVFDSTTGQPVSGARITIIDVATGLPAVVKGNDGVSIFPSSLITGTTVQDAGGESYAFEPGRYQFPRLSPGTYRFTVEPPQGYKFPSTMGEAVIKALPGAPFALASGSHGESFTLVPGPALEIDVPVDPGPLGDVNILKSAGKTSASAGDFVPYSVVISNRGVASLPSVVIADRLPQGFRYQKGSMRLNEVVAADPVIAADGRSMQVAIGNLAGSATATVRYVALIGADAPRGNAENVAQATGRITSNIAKATLLVKDDLNRTRVILAGRVSVAETCEAHERQPASAQGLRNVRILLQDGTSIITDEEGNWHADNVRPGTHVVQVDETTLPQDAELKNCDPTNRTGGRNFSQFVNVRGGTLWRADFRLVRAQSCLNQQLARSDKRVQLVLGAPVANEGATATIMLPAGAKVVAGSVALDGRPFDGAQLGEGFVVLRLPAQKPHWRRAFSFELEGGSAADLKAAVRVQVAGKGTVALQPLVLAAQAPETRQCSPLPVAGGAVAAETTPAEAQERAAESISLVEKLPYDDKWIAAAEPGNEWLHPRVGFAPALPVVKVAVKHARGTMLELKVNGAPVDPLRYEGAVASPSGELVLSQWRSVDLKDGANVMELTIRDAQGKLVSQESRTLHYSVAPAKAFFDLQRSQLVADGRTQPVVAVRMLDAVGQPARRGVTGAFTVSAPYMAQQAGDAVQREPLSGNVGGTPKFVIGEDGVALIPLAPTTQSGEVVLKFNFGEGRIDEIRAWLNADMREWVLVGFAEGTLGQKRLSGNMEALKGSGEQLFDENRVAFYAKGQIKGEYLLTAAYDSAKERNSAGATANTLKQVIDPNQYYTLYGDATQAQYDAASTRKLYLKIEKKQFYALYGDFDTGLTVTQLGRYSRTLNGAKAEYKGETLSYNAFAARTSQSYLKDELQGDGTTGLYRLRGRNVLINSEKIRIDVRDRFQPDRVLSSKTLSAYLDYQFDYSAGTVYFREPVASRDEALNPVFIVVEYESDDQANASWTYGGRAAVKVGEKSEVGVTHLHEGNVGRESSLTSADTTIRLGDSTTIKAEVATSKSNTAAGPQSGQAYLAEIVHDDGKTSVRGYASGQQPGFGLGQQIAAAQGQRKIGAEARVKLNDQLSVQGEAYRQEDLSTGAQREVAAATAQWKNKDGLTVTGGGRIATETDSTGAESQARQATGGVAYEMMDKRLVLRATTDLDVGSRGTANFPNRLTLGADYKLTADTAVFATQEFARGAEVSANTTRVGLRSALWSGAEVQLAAGNQTTLDAGRLYASMGLVQRFKINEQWSSDVGVERVQTLKSTTNPLGSAQTLASGTSTTAASGIVTGDFTAVSGGLAYKDDLWSGNVRAEWRGSDTGTKVNLLAGAQRSLGKGEAVAAGLAVLTESGATDSRNVTARLSYAYRPATSQWMFLEKLEYLEEKSQTLAAQLFTRKLVNNFNANWKATRDTQVAMQYSAKYVREMLGDTNYSGYTDLIGIEARHDLGERWDIGVHAGLLRTLRTGGRSYQLGLSVGYQVADNTWVSVGYNQYGFTDPDFSGAEYRGKGLYVNLRMKFDQDTFDLNDRKAAATMVKP
jgi:uncharacterized repeat protein (TIGR01451 family)